jgi:hypothetical protein
MAPAATVMAVAIVVPASTPIVGVNDLSGTARVVGDSNICGGVTRLSSAADGVHCATSAIYNHARWLW